MSTLIPDRPTIIYPDSDGQPMADNTLQFQWIVTIKDNLELLFQANPDVFVAGDLLWYPVEGHPEIRQAPDVLVACGRPKGYRGSYRQWEEAGVAPQVVFEILSPGNRPREMVRKFQFYERYGVEEYYVYDPDHIVLDGWQRRDAVLREIDEISGWSSPRLGIRFRLTEGTLRIERPDGEPFLTFVQLDQLRQQAQRQAEQAQRQAEQAQRQAEQAQRQADEARHRAERLAAQLRALGVDPEA